MTALATAAGMAPVNVWNGLRNWAAHQPAWVGAAVELLIWNETWPRRRDFLTAATRHHADDDVVAIRWADAAKFAETARGSSSELTVLQFAIVLGTDQLLLSGIGFAHRKAFVDAFTAAAGGPMNVTWTPCCPRCQRELAEVRNDAAPAVLGTCPVHGDVQSGAEWWGEPISEETHRQAADPWMQPCADCQHPLISHQLGIDPDGPHACDADECECAQFRTSALEVNR